MKTRILNVNNGAFENMEASHPNYDTITDIIAQLKSCNFECEAGGLEQNIAFKALQEFAEMEEQEKPWNPSFGDYIYAIDKKGGRRKRIFIAIGKDGKIACVNNDDEDLFFQSKPFTVLYWENMEPYVEKVKFSLNQAIEALAQVHNVDIESIELSE